MDTVINETSAPKANRGRRITYLILSLVALATCALTLFLPFCAYVNRAGAVYTLVPLSPIQFNSALQSQILLSNSIAYLVLAVFVIWILVLLASLIIFLLSLRGFLNKDENAQAKGTKLLLITVTAYTMLLFLGGMILGAVSQSVDGDLRSVVNVVPMIIAVVLDSVFAFLRGFVADQRRLRSEDDPNLALEARRLKKVSRAARLELFLFTIAIAVVSVISLLVDLLTVRIYNGDVEYTALRVTGWSFIRKYAELNEGGQLITFFLFLMLLLMGTLLLMSIIGFFSRSKWFYKLSLGTVGCGALCSLLVGMFGKYYQIVQKMNEMTVASLVETYLGPLPIELTMPTYKVTSTSFYFFLGLVVILCALIARRPFTKGSSAEKILEQYECDTVYKKIQGEVAITDIQIGGTGAEGFPFGGMGGMGKDVPEEAAPEEEPEEEEEEIIPPKPIPEDRDPCPAFTELDEKLPQFEEELEQKRQALFQDPTLPKLVQFIVNYARDSRLHLSYTQEDIAAFLAGLGMSKLTILQGMSGTGKTSLPKIFSEALCARCDIVEVESSWRDKSELLGYYNEFSKMYTPKKFTQALYRARLNPDTLTFIVLDEMNLSRIEYYFSDFLSLMEHEVDKRELKLLNVGLFRTKDGEQVPYAGLQDGHTVKIPQNIWFIGTANRDESTFEISDKVYDRAHTMNFNKRAPKVLYYNDPIPPQYLPVDLLNGLFEKAKAEVSFNIDTYPAIAEVEKLLAPYNISFGNRVAMQIESFVSVYCSCFSASDAVVHDAVETILLSKVVSKLELKSVENKEQLAAEFEKLQFHRCSEFIQKIHED
ncbi:MAG: hypothetical protein IJW44_02115 [Clostridia bacterium]|nr:hypothetical protein [Clostridia bacterium]